MKVAGKLHQMSLACNDAELAISNFTDVVELFKNADATIAVTVNLGDLRQLVNCYPALNAIVNDPAFTCRVK